MHRDLNGPMTQCSTLHYVEKNARYRKPECDSWLDYTITGLKAVRETLVSQRSPAEALDFAVVPAEALGFAVVPAEALDVAAVPCGGSWFRSCPCGGP